MRLAVLLLAVATTPAPSPPGATPAGGNGDAPRAIAKAAKTDVTVGEPFTVDVAATGPAGVTFTFPEDAGNDQVELRTAVDPQGTAVALPGVHRYQATTFAVGDVSVPAITVTFRRPDGTEGTLRTEPIPLRIVSLLPKGEGEPKLADIHGPGAVSIGSAFWIALAAGVLLLAGLIALGIRRRRRAAQAPAPVVPDVPPDVDALRALEALARSGALERGDARAFYIELVTIVKRYLERRLEAPLLEMTSQEAGLYLKAHPVAGPLAGAFREMCGAADQVKFARGGAVVDEGQRHLSAARSLVSMFESRLRASAQALAAASAPPTSDRATTGKVA